MSVVEKTSKFAGSYGTPEADGSSPLGSGCDEVITPAVVAKLKAQGSGFGWVGAKHATSDDMRKLVGEFLRKGNPSETKAFWDLIVCLRGPDWPSERPSQPPNVASKRYGERLDRKYRTVEIIRAAAFGGVVGGAAKSHKGTKVQLPPASRWDHFDKHVERAARVLGLAVEEVNYGYDE